jgi:hypothetical protein
MSEKDCTFLSRKINKKGYNLSDTVYYHFGIPFAQVTKYSKYGILFVGQAGDY